MLSPDELSNYSFPTALRGYNTTAVDSQCQLMLSNYDMLYREHLNTEKNLRFTLNALKEAQEKIAELSELLEQANRQPRITPTEEQARKILADAREYSDRMIADADAHVEQQKIAFQKIRESTLHFRDTVYEQYLKHINALEELSAEVENATFDKTVPTSPEEAENTVLLSEPAEQTEECADEDEDMKVYVPVDSEPKKTAEPETVTEEETVEEEPEPATEEETVEEEPETVTDEAETVTEEVAETAEPETVTEDEAVEEEEPAEPADEAETVTEEVAETAEPETEEEPAEQTKRSENISDILESIFAGEDQKAPTEQKTDSDEFAATLEKIFSQPTQSKEKSAFSIADSLASTLGTTQSASSETADTPAEKENTFRPPVEETPAPKKTAPSLNPDDFRFDDTAQNLEESVIDPSEQLRSPEKDSTQKENFEFLEEPPAPAPQKKSLLARLREIAQNDD